MPMRTPEAPSGWNQWVNTVAPLSCAQSMTAAATLSADVFVHEWSFSVPAARPC